MMAGRSRFQIGPLRSRRPMDQSADLHVYTPDRDSAALTLWLIGPRGVRREETVQLDGKQRRELAAVLAGHSDWTGWFRDTVTRAIADHLNETDGTTDDNEELAAELAPVILHALHYTE